MLADFWKRRAYDDRLFFLSTLTVSSHHDDVMQGRTCTSSSTRELETTVVDILKALTAPRSLPALIGSVLCLATSINYHEDDFEASEMHYGFIAKSLGERGGFAALNAISDLGTLVIM